MDRVRELLSTVATVAGVVLLVTVGPPGAGPAASEGGGTPKDGTNSFAVALSDMMQMENVKRGRGRKGM